MIALACLLAPAASFAAIGVGVGAGKLAVTEKLKPGQIYELPPLPVLNTGDEPAEYGISIEYHQDQAQLQPPRDWFRFDPATFHLDPQQSQAVSVTLTVPINAVPGDYFSYVEAHPIKSDVAGVTSIGIAAAAKLYFTVSPANVFQGAYYRIASLMNRYSPWTYGALGVIAAAILLSILSKFFSFSVGIKKK